MSLIVRKLTELGVHRLTPLVSARTSARSKGTLGRRLARWRRIADEAAKQSGRATVPQIETPLTFGELVVREHPSVRILACPGGQALPKIRRPRSCLVAIGPEGGWTDFELDLFAACRFHRVSPGWRTLRSDVACIALLALVSEWVHAAIPDSPQPD